MPFVLLLIGAVLIVSAYQNTQHQLVTELETDIPPFVKWALAIAAVGGLGWVPGMEKISRWLLGLVLVAIVLSNWSRLSSQLSGLTSAFGTSSTASTTTPTTPAAAYEANPSSPNITTADIQGGSGISRNVNAASQTNYTTNPIGAYDPAAYLTAFEAGIGGFGGVA